MSVKMMFAAMNIETGNPITKLVLIKLADNADDNGVCWPSHKTISRICEISEKTSQRHVKILQEIGLLTIEKRKGKNGNDSNKYTLNLPITHSDRESPTLATESRLHSDRESPTPSDRESPESVSSFNQSMNPISQELIDEFKSHRKAIKKPMTDIAVERLIKKLARCKDEGYNIDRMIDDAIINGWQSVVVKNEYKTPKSMNTNYDFMDDAI